MEQAPTANKSSAKQKKEKRVALFRFLYDFIAPPEKGTIICLNKIKNKPTTIVKLRKIRMINRKEENEPLFDIPNL